LALGYAGVDARLVTKAFAASMHDGVTAPHVQFGEIKSEGGMAKILSEKRDQVLNKSIVAPVSSFNSIWDSGYADYLRSGGQAIMDERAAKWKEFYGDATSIP
jgi:putative aldouronate transport system substrate-binding protein